MTNPTPEQQLLSILGGQLQAMNVSIKAMLAAMPESQLPNVLTRFDALSAHQEAVIIPTPVPDLHLEALQEGLQSMRALIAAGLQ